MDAAQALADLTEISSQVEQVSIVDEEGAVLASTARDPVRAERFVTAVGRLLAEAERLAKSRGLLELAQLEVSTLGGSVFVVRRGGRTIAATTRADPTVGLVLYDLKHCLGSIEETAGGRADATEPAATSSHPGSGSAGRPEPPETRKTGPEPARTARRKADTSA